MMRRCGETGPHPIAARAALSSLPGRCSILPVRGNAACRPLPGDLRGTETAALRSAAAICKPSALPLCPLAGPDWHARRTSRDKKIRTHIQGLKASASPSPSPTTTRPRDPHNRTP